MRDLIKDTLAYIKQEFDPHSTLLMTSEESEYFFQTDLKKIKTITLEPSVNKPMSEGMEEMRKMIALVAPEMKLQNEIPDDGEAKKIANMWKEQLKSVEVAIFSFGEVGKNLAFLQNVAKAIDALITPAKVIDAVRFEKEKKWPLFFEAHPLKLILTPGVKLWRSTDLATFYKENPSTSQSLLGQSPLLFMQPTANYLKNPQEKRMLWKTIVSHLSS